MIILLFLVFSIFTAKDHTYFKRVPVQPMTSQERVSSKEYKQFLKKKKLQHLESKDFDYIYAGSEAATFKGSLLVRGDEAKEVEFIPKLKGMFNLYIECFLLAKNRNRVEILQNGKIIFSKEVGKGGIISLSVEGELELSRNDRFRLTVEGGEGAVAVIGNPVFYKPVQAEEKTHV
ncbi:MAG: hypothetical protein GY940_23145, partial [bacterium]|nr:hypothetical protein [bacterium]